MKPAQCGLTLYDQCAGGEPFHEASLLGWSLGEQNSFVGFV